MPRAFQRAVTSPERGDGLALRRRSGGRCRASSMSRGPATGSPSVRTSAGVGPGVIVLALRGGLGGGRRGDRGEGGDREERCGREGGAAEAVTGRGHDRINCRTVAQVTHEFCAEGWIDPRNALACSIVRAFRRFTVRPVLPEPLGALSVLAGNLRWSWHPPTQDVFSSIDPQVWRDVAGRPGPLPRRRRPRAARRAGRRRRLPGPARRRPRRPPALPHRGPLVRPQGRRRRAALDRLLLARVRHHRPCCRSTPAVSASSPATTSRRPPTSASR